jgi:ATP-dependent RNA helicase HelY
VAGLRARLRAHPCHGCPDREAHARWANRLDRAEREHAALEERIAARTSSIARDFDRVCDVLAGLGYIELRAGEWRATDAGRMLARVYAERDILIAESLRTGAWDGLGPAQLAGAVTALVYESRHDDGAAATKVPRRLEGAMGATASAAGRIEELERQAGVPLTAPVDAAASGAVMAWAAGATLGAVLEEGALGPGDFVRLAGQVVDVLHQIALVAATEPLRDTAAQAAQAVRRGVVAASPA